jgi:hypothetical protein
MLFPLAEAVLVDAKCTRHRYYTNGTGDRHPEVPALLRGPRRMVTSSCMLASFEARFARTSSDERNCAHAGMTQ